MYIQMNPQGTALQIIVLAENPFHGVAWNEVATWTNYGVERPKELPNGYSINLIIVISVLTGVATNTDINPHQLVQLIDLLKKQFPTYFIDLNIYTVLKVFSEHFPINVEVTQQILDDFKRERKYFDCWDYLYAFGTFEDFVNAYIITNWLCLSAMQQNIFEVRLDFVKTHLNMLSNQFLHRKGGFSQYLALVVVQTKVDPPITKPGFFKRLFSSPLMKLAPYLALVGGLLSLERQLYLSYITWSHSIIKEK